MRRRALTPARMRARRQCWRRALAAALCAAPAAALCAQSDAAGPPDETAGLPATHGQTPQAQMLATSRMWVAKHRDDLALAAIRKALLIAPADPVLLEHAVAINLRLGDARAAQALLARLETVAPNAAATRQMQDLFRAATSGRQTLATIRLMARSGQSEEAARRLAELYPHGAPPGAAGAEYYGILGGTAAGYDEAVAALRERIAHDPDDTEAAFVLARLLTRRGQTRPEAERIAAGLVHRDDVDHSQALDLWRLVLQQAGTDPAYLDSLHAYLKLAPGDGELAGRVGELDARVAARRRLARDPDYIAEQQGLRALDRGDLAGAEPLLARAARARPSDADAVGGLGVVRLREGRDDEARALFERAAGLAPENRAKWTGLARTARVWGTIAQGREAAAAGRAEAAQRAAETALSLDPGNAQASLLLVDALLAQRKWSTAEPMLRRLLAQPQPDVGAVSRMQTLLQATGRADQLGPLIDALEVRVRAADERRQLRELRADLLAQEAQRLAQLGKDGPAAERYEAALRAAPDAPWTRFALARIYRDLGLPQLGRTVMEEGLGVAPSPDMRYASALYRSSIDDLAGAKAVLADIPESARTDGMRALARRLDAQTALAGARRALAEGDRAQSERLLAQASALAADDPYVTASVAASMIDSGDAQRGLALMQDWMAAHPGETDADVKLRYGDLLGSAGSDAELDAWLHEMAGEPGLTQAQLSRLDDQALRLVLRETDAAIEAQDYKTARRLLDKVAPQVRLDKRYALEVANLERAQGRYDAAQAALAPVLAATPADPDAQLALARVLEARGQRQAALERVQRVLATTPPEDVQTRLSAARRLASLRRTDEALALTTALQAAYPTRSDVTLEAGHLAQDKGEYETAAQLYRRSLDEENAEGASARGPDGTPAQAALAELAQRRDPEVEAAWMPAYKSGDDGISSYRAQQVPIYVQLPYRYDGHFFAHFDVVHLDAGTLSLSDPPSYALQTFGTYSAFADAAHRPPPGDLHQLANGVGMGVGYLSDAWRIDLGTSPLGFPIHYLVGGVRYRFDAGPASISISASRRPETSSELAYAGLRDPWTGALWGGVRRDGLDWHVGADVGRASVFVDAGAGELTGVHVASNQGFTLRTGFTVPVYERAGMRVTTGLIGNAWHYTDNLRFYTYGQGGYYSPQRYLSLGVPIEWNGRRGALKWDVTATVGMSSSYERDSPYYPNGLPNTPSARASAATLATLVYRGGTSGIGFSYGFTGTLEYRFNPRLVAGVQLAIDRSHDYAPSSAMVYARYSFDARKADTSLWPRPVRLYSSY